MTRIVREPIQVYLTPEERAELDRVAEVLGVSRSEVLRRGIQAVGAPGYRGPLCDLAEDRLVTPPTVEPGRPTPSAPVACLSEWLQELSADRGERRSTSIPPWPWTSPRGRPSPTARALGGGAGFELHFRVRTVDPAPRTGSGAVPRRRRAPAPGSPRAWLELRRSVLERALDVRVRTLDALRLAWVSFLQKHGCDVVLATYDGRMPEAAQAMGIPLAYCRPGS